MLYILRAIIIFLLIFPTSLFGAALSLKDEGVHKGWVTSIDCVGGGVTATATGVEGTVTIAAGAGSMTTVKEATVQVGDADIAVLDFGAGFDLTEAPDTEINIALDLSEYAGYNNTNWDTAYGWGDHAGGGYLVAEVDPAAVLLEGRAGGQIIKGGTGINENLSFWTNATGTIGHYYLVDLTDNGFVKTNSGTGELSIDTNTYLTAEVDGSTTNEINTITCPDANVTAGLAITFADTGNIAITEAGDTITFTVTAYSAGDFLTLVGHTFAADTAAVTDDDTTHLPTCDGVYDFCETTQAYYNAIGDLPTAAVTNGDTTHISTADAIYDFCETTQAYYNSGDAIVTAELTIDTAGVNLDTDGDGSLTITGLGDGFDESLTLDFDSTSNTVNVTTSTAVGEIDFAGISIDTEGSGSFGAGITDDTLAIQFGSISWCVGISGADCDLSLGTGDITTTGPLGSGTHTIGGATGVSLAGATEILTLAGIGGTYNENLTIDFDGAAENKVYVGTGTGVTTIDFGAIVLDADLTGDASGSSGSCTGNSATATLASTLTITDNEDTAENNAVLFTSGGDLDGGDLGIESDGTFYYTPSTGVVTATGFAGALTGNCSGSSGSCTGNAATATALETTRAIGGVNFDGTAAITPTTIAVTDESADTSCYIAYFTDATGNLLPKTGTNLTFNSSTGVLTATGFAGDLTGNVTGDCSGSSGSCTGNSATVTNGVYTTDNLSALSATTSAQLYGLLSDETGSGGGTPLAVFNYNPTLTGATIPTDSHLIFRDAQVYIASLNDGYLDLEADTEIRLNADVRLTGNAFLLTENYSMQFRDNLLYVNSDDDGHLDLHADTSIDLDAPTITFANATKPVKSIYLSAAGATLPTSSYAGLQDFAGTNFTYRVLAFDTSADEKCFWTFPIPDNFTGSTVTFTYYWTTDDGGAAETVQWEVDTGGYANDQAFKTGALGGTTQGTSDTWIANGDLHVVTSSAMTCDWTAGDLATVYLFRDVSDDDLGADCYLIGVKIEYSIGTVGE